MFFYIKHHFLSVVRSKSFGGEGFAFFLLFVLGYKSIWPIVTEMESMRVYVGEVFETSNPSEAVMVLFVLIDLFIRMLLRRPNPQIKHYILITNNTAAISRQYLFTSLFGIIPFLMLFPVIGALAKAHEWLGSEVVWAMIFWTLTNFYLALGLQHSRHKLIGISIYLLVSVLLMIRFDTIIESVPLFHPLIPLASLLVAMWVAYKKVSYRLSERNIIEGQKHSFLSKIAPSLTFKNALYQLEWALLVRNKRTRTNIVMGLVSIAILPFLLKESSPLILSMLIFLFGTSFFIVQHGIYSLGWEGAFFDFLITNFSAKEFLNARRKFYLWTCLFGFLFCLIPTLWLGNDLRILLSATAYNIGVTIPITLYRSLLNKTKIDLSGNSLTNYNGMLTGPTLVSSMLIVITPFFLYGIGIFIEKSMAIYFPGIIGLIGIVIWPKLLNSISGSWNKRKYELSQSFKS